MTWKLLRASSSIIFIQVPEWWAARWRAASPQHQDVPHPLLRGQLCVGLQVAGGSLRGHNHHPGPGVLQLAGDVSHTQPGVWHTDNTGEWKECIIFEAFWISEFRISPHSTWLPPHRARPPAAASRTPGLSCTRCVGCPPGPGPASPARWPPAWPAPPPGTPAPWPPHPRPPPASHGPRWQPAQPRHGPAGGSQTWCDITLLIICRECFPKHWLSSVDQQNYGWDTCWLYLTFVSIPHSQVSLLFRTLSCISPIVRIELLATFAVNCQWRSNSRRFTDNKMQVGTIAFQCKY